MRRCPGCDQIKPIDAFAQHPSRRSGIATYCRECYRRKHREHYRRCHAERRAAIVRWTKQRRDENARIVYDYLVSHACVDCGESDPIVLDFDHVRGVKRAVIERLVAIGCSRRVLLAEIAKCEIRCANCHRRKTARERGYRRYQLSMASRSVRERPVRYAVARTHRGAAARNVVA